VKDVIMKLPFGSSSSRLKSIEQKMDKTILFVCVENSARSQMAEGFFRKYAPKVYITLSAGTKPTAEINPLAIQLMREFGIDISKQKPKGMTEDMIRNSAKIVNMGCIDKSFCPTLFINNVIDWRIEDLKGKPVEKVREIRDEIERRVRQLAADLNKQDS
jgi:arsenate reductase (thioredoxin)